jgi:hypothetical protein
MSMASTGYTYPEQRHGEAAARVEGRRVSIALTDPEACRLVNALLMSVALTAIALTVWGALAPIHF